MTRLGLLLLGFPLLLGLLVGSPAGSIALAQDQKQSAKDATLPEPLTPAAIRELVARLSDAEVRQLLITQLDKAARGPSEDKTKPAMAEDMAGRMDTLRSRAARSLPEERGLVLLARAPSRALCSYRPWDGE